MATLASNFQNIDFANNIGAVHALVQQLGASVTWDGKRVVFKNSCEQASDNLGTYNLNTLVIRFLIGVHTRFTASNLTLQERKDNLAIQEKLAALYETTDDQIKVSCLLTRICSYVREFFASMFFKFEPINKPNLLLLAFTQEQFKTTFGSELYSADGNLTMKAKELLLLSEPFSFDNKTICVVNQDKWPKQDAQPE